MYLFMVHPTRWRLALWIANILSLKYSIFLYPLARLLRTLTLLFRHSKGPSGNATITPVQNSCCCMTSIVLQNCVSVGIFKDSVALKIVRNFICVLTIRLSPKRVEKVFQTVNIERILIPFWIILVLPQWGQVNLLENESNRRFFHHFFYFFF